MKFTILTIISIFISLPVRCLAEHESPSYDLLAELRCMGRSFEENAKDTVKFWGEGISSPMPDLSREADRLLAGWRLNADSCSQIDAEKQLSMYGQRGGAVTDPDHLSLMRGLVEARENLAQKIRDAVNSGRLTDIYNQLAKAYRLGGCSMPMRRIEHCAPMSHDLYGLYVVLEWAPELLIQNGNGYPFKDSAIAIARVLRSSYLEGAEASLPELMYYKFLREPHSLVSINYFLDQERPVEPLPDLPNRRIDPPANQNPFKYLNHWRLNISILTHPDPSHVQNYSQTKQEAAKRAWRLVDEIQKTVNGEYLVKWDGVYPPAAFYSDLNELRAYHRSVGELESADKVTIRMGQLRVAHRELINSSWERLVQGYFWGMMTGFGTRFLGFLYGWGVLGALIFVGLIVSSLSPKFQLRRYEVYFRRRQIHMRVPSILFTNRITLNFFSSCFSKTLLVLTLQGKPEFKSKFLESLTLLLVFAYTSVALGYLVNFLGRFS